MNKKLLFYWYIPNDKVIFPIIYKAHLMALKEYSQIFNDYHFILSVDNKDKRWDDIERTEKQIISAINDKVLFEIVENNRSYSEAPYVEKYVINNVDNYNGLIFFAHTKGYNTQLVPDLIEQEDVYHWVALMYYENLSNITKIENNINENGNFITYGALKFNYNLGFWNQQRYHWHYSGTFFWVNPLKLKQYVIENDIIPNKIIFPKDNQRYYSESILGNLIPWDKSYGDIILHFNDRRKDIAKHYYHGEEFVNYMEFYEKIYTIKTLVCGIGRLENNYIREWVEHYKNLGFTNICLYDNNRDGEEHFEEVIGDYIDSGYVILKNYRNKKSCQTQVYQECYEEYGKGYDWIAFFDIDEFMEIKNYKNISDYLSYTLQFNPDMLHLNWMIYNDESLPIKYNKNIGYNFPENNHVKTILKTCKKIDWCKSNSHTPISQGLKCINNKGESCDANSPFNPYDYTEAYIKHFSTKTAREYAWKMKRGFPDQLWDGSRIKNLVETRFFRTNEITQEKIDIFKEELGIDFNYLLERKNRNMEKNKEVQIFNLCYSKKDYEFYEDSVVTPIQCGAANGTDVCELKDNTEDNISYANFFYVENTGIYWIWRNVKDAKYKGQMQYRRNLEGVNENMNFDELFSKYDAITCEPFHHPSHKKPTKDEKAFIPANTVQEGYAFSNCLDDLLVLEKAVKQMYPDYASDWDKYIKYGENLYYSNGFILKAEDYDKYCEFLFNCLNGYLQFAKITDIYSLYVRVARNIGAGRYIRYEDPMEVPMEGIKWQTEIGGFLSERLWTLWLQHNFKNDRIYKLPYVKMEDNMYT